MQPVENDIRRPIVDGLGEEPVFGAHELIEPGSPRPRRTGCLT
jgi:hypothetical protein